MHERSPSPDVPPIDDIDRHPGTPMSTLEDVRMRHNLVGAYPDVAAAREAILELEQAGVQPRTISLLGAWPAQRPEDRHEQPRFLVGRTMIAAAVGAVVFGVAGAFAVEVFDLDVSVLFGALAGALFGALVAFPTGAIRATGMSDAWKETFAADASGTVAVGVHSDEATDIDAAEPIMAGTEPKAMNRF